MNFLDVSSLWDGAGMQCKADEIALSVFLSDSPNGAAKMCSENVVDDGIRSTVQWGQTLDER